MSGRAGLLPIMLLALVAGCKPASSESARAGNEAKPAEDISAPAAPLAELATNAAANATVAVNDLHPAELVPAKDEAAHSLDLPPSNDTAPADPFPDEVTSFMVDRDGCDHFRGEEPYDPERRAYLSESIAELCTGTDARLAGLRSRYAMEPAVIAALSGYEDKIEGSGTP
jgi:hypothetical protein